MKERKIRIAIAEECGFVRGTRGGEYWVNGSMHFYLDDDKWHAQLPDYLNGLIEIAIIQQWFNEGETVVFGELLEGIRQRDEQTPPKDIDVYHLENHQVAEAFLRAKRKWIEDEEPADEHDHDDEHDQIGSGN